MGNVIINVADYEEPSVGMENVIAGCNVIKNPVLLKNIKGRLSRQVVYGFIRFSEEERQQSKEAGLQISPYPFDPSSTLSCPT